MPDLSPTLLLVIEYGAWGGAFIHGLLTAHRRSLARVGIYWGIVSAVALLLADGQGAFLGFILFPLICWFLAALGRASKTLMGLGGRERQKR